jgi:hypothetical protein
MKKGLLIIGIAVIIIAVYFLFFNKSADKAPEEPKQQALAQSKNNDAFNKPFNAMLTTYFSLHDALVEWDSVRAPKVADSLVIALNNIPFNELKGDTTITLTAKSFSDNTVAEAKGLAGEKTIEGQRKEFNMVTDNLYNLIRTVHYDQQVIYHDKCPMAFNETDEGFWLSTTSEIINPYLGKKHPHYKSGMLGCGSVVDSVDFRQK